MRITIVLSFLLIMFFAVGSAADDRHTSIMQNDQNQRTFPDLADKSSVTKSFDSLITDGTAPRFADMNIAAPDDDIQVEPTIWPFGDKSSKPKPKSTRKAFFLSLLIPGLGETYVGSKRGLFFMGVEIVAWYMYLTNDSEGNDLEAEYQEFAEAHWHYTDYVHSDGSELYYNYWDWLVNVYDINESEVGPQDYNDIRDILEDNGASHSLPSSKTQQYYEMIGKYDHFVYGWEDIADLNPSLLPIGDGNGTYVGPESTGDIKSDLRLEYMDIRGESNDKLKAGQMGINVMILNRILSAISAGRAAYHHNKQFETDLSKVRIYFAEKYIIDNKVPMLMLTKKF